MQKERFMCQDIPKDILRTNCTREVSGALLLALASCMQFVARAKTASLPCTTRPVCFVLSVEVKRWKQNTPFRFLNHHHNNNIHKIDFLEINTSKRTEYQSFGVALKRRNRREQEEKLGLASDNIDGQEKPVSKTVLKR